MIEVTMEMMMMEIQMMTKQSPYLINHQTLKVTKAAAVDKKADNLTNLGDTITYTITIENTGDVSLSNILVTDVLTDGDGVTSVLSLAYDSSNTAVEGVLVVGESATYTVVYTIDQGAVNSGSVSNNVSATASSPTGASK
jgi:uncharacterized repeat protein (TIGR01451 family)